jgi:hypothetical protein
MLAVTFLIVAVIAEFTERRKKAWRAAVSKILARFEKAAARHWARPRASARIAHGVR